MTEKKMGGMRFNSGKMRFNLIPMDAKVELARVYTVGALKYDDDNWLKGMKWSTMIDCADRHFSLWQMGLNRDPDTGCHHLAMAAWNLLGLLVYELRGLGEDNRTKLPIDEMFNWLSGPGKDLGLPPEDLEALRVKYAKLREEHATKMTQDSGKNPAWEKKKEELQIKRAEVLAATDELKSLAINEGVKVSMAGRLTREISQDTEGYPSYGFWDGQTSTFQEISGGDILTYYDAGKPVTFIVMGKFKESKWPSEMISPEDFKRERPAELIKKTKLFDSWHIEHTIKQATGKWVYDLTVEERNEQMKRYTEMALNFSRKYGTKIDLAEATRTMSSYFPKASIGLSR